MSGLPPHLLGLLRPEAYPHPVRDLRLVETHISWVLLTGEFAYKLKRPVRYPFVDLRSAARRAILCAEEVRLNRRFTPELYLGVSRIVATETGVRVADEGPAIEYAVRMRQFPVEEGLDHLIESGRVERGELEDFGRDLARVHANLPRAEPSQTWGSVDVVRTQLQANLAECRQFAKPHGTDYEVDSIAARLDAQLCRLEREIAGRRDRVRECHGDLHARNLVRHEGRLVAFDCIDFEPAFRWIDVADEVSFLWMDLAAKRRPDLALGLLAGYLDQSGDHEMCRVLRLYGSHRALVRAKVAALEAGTAAQPDSRTAALEQHRCYLQCARELLAPAPPRLVLMSGLSGSGKTWLARQLAPALGAIHVRSDVERKRLAGLTPATPSRSRVSAGLYSAESSLRVYQHLAYCADAALAGGFSVLVDATFMRRAERERFSELAATRGAALACIRCHAPAALLEARILERASRGGDASEADLEVLDWQKAHDEPIAADESLEVIEADTSRTEVAVETLAALAARHAPLPPPHS